MRRQCGMRGARAALTGCQAFPFSTEASPEELARFLAEQALAVWPWEIMERVAEITLERVKASAAAQAHQGQLELSV